MGWLEGPSGTRTRLTGRLLIGRARHCGLVLSSRLASGEHASLRWGGEHWELRDLGSRNRTWVGAEAISGARWTPLVEGDALCFGDTGAPFRLVDASPPVARAHCGAERVEANFGVLLLPDPQLPRASVYRNAQGWQLDLGHSQEQVEDGQEVELDGQLWTLSLPEILDPTREASADALGGLELRFALSQDEEHVELTAHHGGTARAMGSRAHHFLLLALARRRQRDEQEAALATGERGWAYQDDLCRELAIEPALLHLHVFRARNQLAGLGIEGAGGLVERRSQTRELRLGLARVHIGPA